MKASTLPSQQRVKAESFHSLPSLKPDSPLNLPLQCSRLVLYPQGAYPCGIRPLPNRSMAACPTAYGCIAPWQQKTSSVPLFIISMYHTYELTVTLLIPARNVSCLKYIIARFQKKYRVIYKKIHFCDYCTKNIDSLRTNCPKIANFFPFCSILESLIQFPQTFGKLICFYYICTILYITICNSITEFRL